MIRLSGGIMKLIEDLAYADRIAHHLWWDIAKRFGVAVIDELEEAYVDLQTTHGKYDASNGIQKRWHQFWLEGKASRFVFQYGYLYDLAVAAR